MNSYGIIFNRSNWTSLSGISGTTNNSLQAGKLIIGYSGAVDTGYLKVDNTKSVFENYIIRVKCSITGGSGGYDFGVGIVSEQSTKSVSYYSRVANNVLSIGSHPNIQSTSVFSPLKQKTFSGDVSSTIELAFSHKRHKYGAFLKINNTFHSVELPGTLEVSVGSFALFLKAGSITIQELSIDVLDNISPKFLCIGDSITRGRYLNKIGKGWMQKLAELRNILPHEYVLHAAGSARHIDLASHAAIIGDLNQNAENVFILLGDNDDYNNSSSWKPYRQDILDALYSSQNIYNLTNTPEVSDPGYSIIKNLILSDFENTINIWQPLQRYDNNNLAVASYYMPDGVHPNESGCAIIASTINDNI